MIFSSLTFLFIFIPLFFLIYYLKPCNGILFAGSLVFYAAGVIYQPWYLVLMIFSIFVNYRVGLKIERSAHKKAWLSVGVIYDFFWLTLFKYTDFLIKNINVIGSLFSDRDPIPLLNLVLPVGISFYTFQIVSYLIDVYRGGQPAEKSFVALGTYLCMFPQLIAGPIVSYHTISDQLHGRKISMSAVESGLRTFTVGLGMKVLLANRIGNLWTDVYGIGYESISTPLAWLAAAAYSMQLYFDFYGYSLMAMGLGEMLGFRLPENFRHPYQAVSLTEFWNRWHITLSSWFRDYVYIPLGGNRVSFMRMLFNLFVVWLLTGLWHGASWNFVLWGMVSFFFLMLEKWILYPFLEKHRMIGHLYMFLLILVTWSIFAITDFGQLAIFLERLFPFVSGQSAGTFASDFLKYLRIYGVTMGIGLVFCTDYPARWFQKHRGKAWMAVGLLAVFWGSVYYLYLGLDNPFLYFRF